MGGRAAVVVVALVFCVSSCATSYHGEAVFSESDVVRMETDTMESASTDDSAPSLVKVAVWGLIGFSAIVLLAVLIDEPLIDLSP